MEYDEIGFSSKEDGLNLAGWVLHPEESPKMTVIFAHGYKGNRFEDHVSFFTMADDLLEKGYRIVMFRSEEHTSELQSRFDLVCRLLLVKKQAPIGTRLICE